MVTPHDPTRGPAAAEAPFHRAHPGTRGPGQEKRGPARAAPRQPAPEAGRGRAGGGTGRGGPGRVSALGHRASSPGAPPCLTHGVPGGLAPRPTLPGHRPEPPGSVRGSGLGSGDHPGRAVLGRPHEEGLRPLRWPDAGCAGQGRPGQALPQRPREGREPGTPAAGHRLRQRAAGPPCPPHCQG